MHKNHLENPSLFAFQPHKNVPESARVTIEKERRLKNKNISHVAEYLKKLK